MKPHALIITDIHLTEKSEDRYRFEIFPWIEEKFGKRLDKVFILGDLTDRKDFHAGWFVNKVVEHLRELSNSIEVYAIKGNHDYDADQNNPFFRFLRDYEKIHYFTDPAIDKDGVLFLPHSRDPKRDWKILNRCRPGEVKTIMMHQTFDGAISESGYEMRGVDWKQFEKWNCPVYSGDIHKPQKLGPITYVGSPFHIRYGDKFKPRCLLLDRNFHELREVQFPAPRKLVFEIERATDMHSVDAKRGDMVKVRVFMPRSKFTEWPEQRDIVRSIAAKKKIKLHSVVPKERKARERPRIKKRVQLSKTRDRKDIYKAFCDRYDLRKDLTEAGKEFMS